MHRTIRFLESNLDKIESLLAEDYKRRKGFTHDHCYFEVTEKFQSSIDETTFEAVLILAKIDHEATKKANTIGVIYHVQHSFDCGFVYRRDSDIELMKAVKNWMIAEMENKERETIKQLETNNTNEDEKQGTTEAN